MAANILETVGIGHERMLFCCHEPVRGGATECGLHGLCASGLLVDARHLDANASDCLGCLGVTRGRSLLLGASCALCAPSSRNGGGGSRPATAWAGLPNLVDSVARVVEPVAIWRR